jgi:hypothetical protein
MFSHGTARLLILGGLLLLLASLWRRDLLPPPEALQAAVREEPLQQPTALAPFETTAGGITYTIKPVFSYDISGLVVSRHDTSAWWDWIHAAWDDHLNVADLCVVFGDNARTGAYLGIRFRSGQFVCEASTDSAQAWQAFSMAALSNNHLLTDRPAAARLLRELRPGDQVRIRGELAEYGHHHGQPFWRGTSVTRTDTGNGACETIWVRDVQVLARGGGAWRMLFPVGGGAMLAGVALWLLLPIRIRA